MPIEPFGYAINTSTIKRQRLVLPDAFKLAADLGYGGIEPWIDEIDRYTASGRSLSDLALLAQDLGLEVVNAIGFFEWIVDDKMLRTQGMEEARRNMDIVAQLGGHRIAAPPFGAQDKTADAIDLFRVADRYHTLLELGKEFGVVPMVELWGFSKNLSRLGEVLMVVVEGRHDRASLLLDVYHLYKGGSFFSGLGHLAGQLIGLFHFNDYPATPDRSVICDADRVYPGDGIAPLEEIIRELYTIGYRGMLSLELFNEIYWSQDAATVLRTGLEKMQAVVREALAATQNSIRIGDP